MKLYHYVSVGYILGIVGILHAMPPVRDRKPGDERKFEATHILWQQHDTRGTRRELIDSKFNNERVYLRSGSVIGMREFHDPATLIFELATGSRLGHVAVAFSAADMIEVLLRFIERGEGIKEGVKGRQVLINVDDAVKDLDKAYAPYIALASEWNGGQWERKDKKGKIRTFHPFKDRSSRVYSSAFYPLDDLIGDLLHQPAREGGYENAYEALPEVRDNIKKGQGRFYQPHTEEGRRESSRGPLDVPILLHFYPVEGLMMQANLSADAYAYAGGECSGMDAAIDQGNTSVIEPERDLTIEEIEKMVFYCLYLKQAGAEYNYAQSDAGMFCQNCSEFIHNLFQLVELQVGFKQPMGTLYTGALGGGLKNYGRLLRMYGPDKVVVTPKGVMQTAVPYHGPLPEGEGYPWLSMRVVEGLDRLDIATTVSEHTLWKEWDGRYQEMAKTEPTAKYLGG